MAAERRVEGVRPGRAPRTVHMAAPSRFARASVVAAGHPRRRPARKAAENASPAPTESSAGPGSGWPGATRADTERPRRVKRTAPDAPRVTTSREQGNAASRASARPRVPGPRRRSAAVTVRSSFSFAFTVVADSSDRASVPATHQGARRFTSRNVGIARRRGAPRGRRAKVRRAARACRSRGGRAG